MSRTRSVILINEVNTSIATSELSEEVYYDCNGKVTQTINKTFPSWARNTYPQKFHERTMTDVVIPNFHTRSAKGEIFINPLTKTDLTWEWTAAERSGTQEYWKYSCTPTRELCYEVIHIQPHQLNPMNLCLDKLGFDPIPSIEASSIETLKAKAISQSWGNISQEQILALVSLAEAEKSLGTATSVLRGVVRLLRFSRKRALKSISQFIASKRRRRQLFRDLCDIYLEARYGLRPMYYDMIGVRNAYSLISRNKAKANNRITARGYEYETGNRTFPKTLTYASAVNGSTATIRCDCTDVWEVTVRAGALAQVTLDVNSILGIGLIGQTVWELVPFSFIIDWFLNTADVIASWSPNPNARVLGTWVTVDSTICRTGEFSISNTSTSAGSRTIWGTLGQTLSGGQFSVISKKLTRVPNPSRPIIPSWDVRLDPLKLLDLGAIGLNLRKEFREFKSISSGYKFKGS